MRAAISALAAALGTIADPIDAAETMALLRQLHAIGRRDLPLGRLFEGHVDALQIVTRYGTTEQARRAAQAVCDGGAFGVWNADLPGDPLRLNDGRVHGGKAFASGAGVLSHALVTVDADGGRQLVLIDLERLPPAIDKSWWRTIGMERSQTHLVRWNAAAIDEDDLIGAPGDYIREPWFSGGALRFAAVQAGGVAALMDHVRNHLVATGRAADAHQAGRLATLYAAAQEAANAVRLAGEAWFGANEQSRLPLVAAARAAVLASADHSLIVAQDAVGLQGMFRDHPLSGVLTDLSVYLRQPGPDAQRMRVGEAVAGGMLDPVL